MKIFREILCLFFILIASGNLIFGQNAGTLPSNLSSIHVDQLSDIQIQQIIQKMNENGYTLDQLETVALAQGMPVSEINKLKARINSIGTQASPGGQMQKSRLRNDLNNLNQQQIPGQGTKKVGNYQNSMSNGQNISSLLLLADSMKTMSKFEDRIFGYSLFSNKNLTFQPNLNIPTPRDYQLGPGDEVNIDVWGASQQNYKFTIAPDGFIFIDNVGPVQITGLTVDESSKKVISRLSSIYAGLKGPNPNTWAQLTLGNIRSIQITVIGEVNQPGTYTVSSLSTVFNALYLSGGPTRNGSFRNIEVIRNNKVIDHLDAYDFLLKGDQSNNIRLEDQDIVRVPSYVCRIEFTGEVKRPFIYEVKDTLTETLHSLIAFAGGFTDKAYSERLRIYRNNDREKLIQDVSKDHFARFVLHDGDSIPVEPILNRFKNRVTIQGAVYRPGDYALSDSMKVSELISKAEGLKGDAFMTRALLYRTKINNTIEVIPLDLDQIYKDRNSDVFLKREDLLKVFSIFDLRENYKISIQGQVQNPGDYPYVENSTIRDYIVMSGGLLDAASLTQIEIARRVKDSETGLKKAAEIFIFQIDKDFAITDSSKQFVLQPFDQIYVRRSPGYEEQKTVRIKGEVNYPGDYVISSVDERISDLVKRAGGFSKEAYFKGARLFRKLPVDEKERQRSIIALMQESNDSMNFNISKETEQPIGIDLVKIMSNPHSEFDLILEPGDVLSIPKELQTVQLTGALLYPVTVRYNKGNSFNWYISQAGGYAEDARSSKAYVLYANGSVSKTNHFLFLNFHPKIEPGAEIIIPKKPEKRRLTTGETVGIASALSSLSLVLITIIKML